MASAEILGEKMGFSTREVSRLTGLGQTTIYERIETGELKARKLGRRTLILRRDLETFLEALPAKTEASEAHRGYVRRRWNVAKGAVAGNVSR